MSFATGRDAEVVDLLLGPPPEIRLVTPAVCFMQALHAFRGFRKRGLQLQRELRAQILGNERNVAGPPVSPLLDALNASLTESSLLLTECGTRLNLAIRQLGSVAEFIALTPEILDDYSTTRRIEESTDNLILSSILHHAMHRVTARKAFLSENIRDFNATAARRAILDAGITYFSNARDFFGWHAAGGSGD